MVRLGRKLWYMDHSPVACNSMLARCRRPRNLGRSGKRIRKRLETLFRASNSEYHMDLTVNDMSDAGSKLRTAVFRMVVFEGFFEGRLVIGRSDQAILFLLLYGLPCVEFSAGTIWRSARGLMTAPYRIANALDSSVT